MRLTRIFLVLAAFTAFTSFSDVSFNVRNIETDAIKPVSKAFVMAQDHQRIGNSIQSQKVEPDETPGDLYKVMGVILLVWFGLAFFLFRLDRKIARLEKDVKKIK